ncbi:hypothetical protein MPSEU_000714600 [Mayamaea pseudoterrestris]|nr:hypothetical protein MPSEU_000714600 [Mayamaea pseudoterrestris]
MAEEGGDEYGFFDGPANQPVDNHEEDPERQPPNEMSLRRALEMQEAESHVQDQAFLRSNQVRVGEAESPLAGAPPRIPLAMRPSSQAMLRQQAHSPIHAHPPSPARNQQPPLHLPLSPVRVHQQLQIVPAPQPAAVARLAAGPPLGAHYQDHGPSLRLQHQRPSNLSIHVPESEAGDDSLDSPSPVSGWTEVEVAPGSVAPSARSLHAAALLNGTMYVFGGYDGHARVNSFHAFSFTEKRWYPVVPSANSAGVPSPRDRHVAVAVGNSTICVHGGFNGTSRVADFWAFDLSTMVWREIVPLQGRPPSARHSHSAVVAGENGAEKLLIFGGYDGAYKCDLHEFDFQLLRWSVVPAAGRRPRARYRATCVVHKNNLVLYGGHDGTRHLSDTHIFDLETRTWSSLLAEGVPPIPRDSHVSVMHNHSMYVFAGSSGSAMNDLFELQLPTDTSGQARWRAIDTSSGGFQPSHRFCHVAVAYSDSLFVFGGYSGSDRLNDFIRFDFAVYDLSFEIPPSTILNDFRSMINDSTLSDVTFIVEDKPIYAHKLVLTRCTYFQALFLGNMRESQLESIRMEQVRYPIFMQVIEYLYTDHVRISLHDAMELFEAADLFCIPRLKMMCEKRMLQSITVDNCAAIFHAADMHSAVALRQKAKKYTLSHFDEASKTSAFEEMGRRNNELIFELLRSR